VTLETIVPDWPAPPRVRSLITTRPGGVSRGTYASLNLGGHVGDERDRVERNRARLQRLLPSEPLWLTQVHGTQVLLAEAARPGMQADAAVTRATDAVLAVLSADCLPVLFCDLQATVVAVAHAGWRGLAAGILERTVATLRTPPASLMAFLGPAIGHADYEVGPEVHDVFVSQDPEARRAFAPGRPGKWLADLYALARQRLEKTGIMSIHGGSYCTFTDHERFFSYRRDGETGRMASLIWLER
jgi:YfiH family protein